MDKMGGGGGWWCTGRGVLVPKKKMGLNAKRTEKYKGEIISFCHNPKRLL
jgi:hypothetical protein